MQDTHDGQKKSLSNLDSCVDRSSVVTSCNTQPSTLHSPENNKEICLLCKNRLRQLPFPPSDWSKLKKENEKLRKDNYKETVNWNEYVEIITSDDSSVLCSRKMMTTLLKNSLASLLEQNQIFERLNRMDDIFKELEYIKLVLINKKQSSTLKKTNCIDKSIRKIILRRDNWTCQNCKEQPENKTDLHIDHIIPKSKGGTNQLTNLRVLCKRCNLIKKEHIFNELKVKGELK